MGSLTTSSPDKIILRSAGAASAQGSRPSQQDQYTLILPRQISTESGKNILCSAVYDGHVTADVAIHARENLPRFILDSPDLQTGQYENVIESATKQEEALLWKEFKGGNEVCGESGSTLAVCLLDLTDGVLVVGNLGDSHVLLCEQQTKKPWEVHRITKAHKPGSRTERSRIEEAGGVINQEFGSPRLGSLNMSRALGDLQYKEPLINAARPFSVEQEIAGFKAGQDQGDLLSRLPSIERRELSRDRQYVLLVTSDGVTDEMEDRAVLNRVIAHLGHGLEAREVAGKLVTEATNRPLSDNATCVCVVMDGNEVA
ncbi:PP2C family serine/threonine-protein phosphatase [Aspergillus clavatus NRRL 1]|uniref:Protein phosphatase, putative n=1 Tax=Aspergillus clavatus (strain ATCC 1007 / CBS 513.65 / DSM 816 / NCTC 3887 / NRRL 1 / QM 1276 / 107) TaxID=344612 RepID=A1CBW0_ASPCL|nr:protein phosphatase, putative [Aspergillus clavatus NRRL 1]EAW13228.1 protein phosphatase, putative [Aspergillus clavatus NRRL 1]